MRADGAFQATLPSCRRNDKGPRRRTVATPCLLLDQAGPISGDEIEHRTPLMSLHPDSRPGRVTRRITTVVLAVAAVASLTVGLGVALTWGWRPALLAAAACFVALAVWRGRRLEVYDGTHGHPAEMAGGFLGQWLHRGWIIAIASRPFSVAQ